ncbi:sigma-54-dependent Fis family transcriptional regulator [Pseudomonas sp. 02C 26]|nr:sigma-54-dependent Fis family transcriptional regulator [Pseudomonas sp. 02C 26]
MASHGHILDISYARRSFLEGEQLPPGIISKSLLRSWERTYAAGLRPADRMLFGQSVSMAEARRVSDQHHALIEIATPDVVGLMRSMKSPSWVVLFTNADGTILHSTGNHDLAPRELRLPLQCGRRLPESELGTNAPAVVLSESEASVVQGGEHFLDELSRFSCVAAPVFGLDGALAGVLDATGYDSAIDPRALYRVGLAARSIENRLFAASTSGILIGINEDPRLLRTPLQGLMLVREDGRLLSANRNATQMLQVDPGFVQKGQVLGFEDLVDHRLMEVLGSENIHTVHTHQGALLYLSVLQAPAIRTDPQKALVVSTQTKCGDLVSTLLSRAAIVLKRQIPVLIQGETGTGKEWFARRLHDATRPGKPFIAINCSAIAESLAEAELFGYEEGAYTGSRKGGAPGKIELANGGTLFLDEIGDMALNLQTRLLRSLQERSNVRLGGVKETKIDVQVVSATHRDLASMVEARAFREDLYYRLSGFQVQLPALRDRSDLGQMIQTLMTDLQDGQGCHLPEDVEALLLQYRWPGNIRQLRHVIEVACALSGPSGEIQRDSLPAEILVSGHSGLRCSITDHPPKPSTSLSSLRDEWVTASLAAHNGSVTAAAKALGVSRTTLYRYLQRAPRS